MGKLVVLSEAIPTRIVYMGYETHNSILNLGTVTLLLLIFGAGLVILGLIKLILLCSKYRRMESLYKWLHKKLIFGFVISMFIEAYMEFLIAGYLNF